ncbi:MAG: cold shock domain-containing protein [Alphaproteobacteria bacterium]|nr:cold shock domain-containing protein [Alphaproteobacteria bacterium]
MAWKRDNYGSRPREGRRDDFGGGGGGGHSDHRGAPRGGGGGSSDMMGGGGPRMSVDRSRVTATVKWFNPSKGFGFVAPTDGTPDAFLHISVIERSGRGDVAEGATVICDLGQGQRGPQVVAIHEVDMTTASARPAAAPRRDQAPVSGEPLEGTVKFFSADKGFGFIALDDGGKDVFVHIKALERSGLRTLTPEQRVRMTVSMGLKGPQAETISLV